MTADWLGLNCPEMDNPRRCYQRKVREKASDILVEHRISNDGRKTRRLMLAVRFRGMLVRHQRRDYLLVNQINYELHVYLPITDSHLISPIHHL